MEKIENEFCEFMATHDRGVLGREPLDKTPEIGDIVYNRYYGNGKVIAVKREKCIKVDFNGNIRACHVKFLYKGDK